MLILAQRGGHDQCRSADPIPRLAGDSHLTGRVVRPLGFKLLCPRAKTYPKAIPQAIANNYKPRKLDRGVNQGRVGSNPGIWVCDSMSSGDWG